MDGILAGTLSNAVKMGLIFGAIGGGVGALVGVVGYFVKSKKKAGQAEQAESDSDTQAPST